MRYPDRVSPPPARDEQTPEFPAVESNFLERLEKHASEFLTPGTGASPSAGPRAQAGAEWLAKTIGDRARLRYELRGELGRGAMGAVFEVLDTDLRRTLAMKVALRKKSKTSPQGSNTDPALLARFLEEAQVTGQLDHPCIVPLHEVGMDQAGQVFFTMRLVKGQDLNKVFGLVRDGSEEWTLERAIVALLRVTEAMAYAHSKGVVHRDLKPANVMTGRFGEVYVMDWGLAKVMGRPDRPVGEGPPTGSILLTEPRDGEGDGLGTEEGTVLGTPVYMSPEQARGELERVSARSDIYSVGAMLYHLVAGRPPYLPKGARIASLQVLSWVIEGPPARIREVEPSVAPELAAIAEKAMSRDPADRYADMSALGDDLRAFLVGKPVSALNVSIPMRAVRWCRSNPMATATMIALVLGAGLGLWRLGALTRTLVEQSAIDSAALETQLLQEVNSFYVEAVASRVDKAHVTVTSKWRETANAIPIPATFLTELAERVTDREGKARVRHYSDYPFKNHGRGELDAFQVETLKSLRADPSKPVTRFEEVNGEPVLRYAVARKMEQGCVNCHNTHADSTKTDWKLGEVRGVLEISRPLAADERRIDKGLRGTLILVAAVVGGLFLAALVGVFTVARQKANKARH